MATTTTTIEGFGPVNSLDDAVLASEFSQTKVAYMGVTCTPSGYFYVAGKRVGLDRAQAVITQNEIEALGAAEAPKAKRQPQRTGFQFDRLNGATRALFFDLAEQIRVATGGDLGRSVRLGTEISIDLVDAPRLTNLKKAGVLRTVEGAVKSHKHLQLTELGQAMLQAHL